jgi:hypothetical protein
MRLCTEKDNTCSTICEGRDAEVKAFKTRTERSVTKQSN